MDNNYFGSTTNCNKSDNFARFIFELQQFAGFAHGRKQDLCYCTHNEANTTISRFEVSVFEGLKL